MERFEFITSDDFDNFIEVYGEDDLDIYIVDQELKKHIIFNVDVAYEIVNWNLLSDGNLEVLIDIK